MLTEPLTRKRNLGKGEAKQTRKIKDIRGKEAKDVISRRAADAGAGPIEREK